MADRVVLQVDVASADFDKFKASFDDYAKSLSQTLATWRQITAEIKIVTNSVANIAAPVTRATSTLQKFTSTLGQSAKHSRSMFQDVEGITKNLVSWKTAFGTTLALMGLGGGGLWGLTALTGSAAASRARAQSMGMGYGTMTGLGAVGGYFPGGGAAAQGWSTAQWDIQSDARRGAQVIFGADADRQLNRKDQLNAMFEGLDKATGYLDQFDKAIRGNIAASSGITALYGDAVRQWDNMSQAEKDVVKSRAEAAKTEADASDKAVAQWAAFNMTLQSSKSQVESVLIRGLAPLAGPLTDLSGALTNALKAFLETKEVQTAIQGFATEIQKWANWLNTSEGQEKFNTFIKNVALAGEAIVAFVAVLTAQRLLMSAGSIFGLGGGGGGGFGFGRGRRGGGGRLGGVGSILGALATGFFDYENAQPVRDKSGAWNKTGIGEAASGALTGGVTGAEFGGPYGALIGALIGGLAPGVMAHERDPNDPKAAAIPWGDWWKKAKGVGHDIMHPIKPAEDQWPGLHSGYPDTGVMKPPTSKPAWYNPKGWFKGAQADEPFKPYQTAGLDWVPPPSSDTNKGDYNNRNIDAIKDWMRMKLASSISTEALMPPGAKKDEQQTQSLFSELKSWFQRAGEREDKLTETMEDLQKWLEQQTGTAMGGTVEGGTGAGGTSAGGSGAPTTLQRRGRSFAPTPTGEGPAGIPGTAGGTISGGGDVNAAINATAKAAGMDPAHWKAIASIESGLKPGAHNQYGYSGLFQMGTKGGQTWSQYGHGGNVFDPMANAQGAAALAADNARIFKKKFGRDPTPAEIYLMHQQGVGFYTRGTLTNPMGNLPPELRHLGRVPTHAEFEQAWTDEVNKRAAQFSSGVYAAAPSGEGVTPDQSMPGATGVGRKRAKEHPLSHANWQQKDQPTVSIHNQSGSEVHIAASTMATSVAI